MIQNLAINAAQAMPTGGPARFTSRGVKIGKGDALGLAPG
jgi:hypothetical protein